MTTSFINDSNSLSEVDCGWTNLIELLRSRALQHPEKLAYTFLRDGETEEASLSYGDLDRRARKLAAYLQSVGATGQRVLLLYPPDLEYVSAFFACLYAGAVAVPAYPPRQNRNLDRLQAIIIDAQARFALTTSQIRSRMEPVLKQSGLKGFRLLDTAEVEQGSSNDWFEPAITGGSLAFLQYTSGSTSTPKGVMVTHGNLLHNQRMIQQAFRQTEDSLIAGWLPLYHDMGLIGNVLQPLYVGASAVLMSPVAFLQSPFRWLQVISQYRATTSGGPNFAYDLCARKITAEQRAQLDLSSWEVAFNGAEPVRVETMDRFSKAFAPHGFVRDAFFPCYGLAEGTLFVSGKSGPVAARSFDTDALANNLALEVEEEQTESYKLVGCGGPYLEQKILIVNAETLNECLPGSVGEIWISGASVAKGYWNQPDTTAQTFHAYVADTGEGPFLRTGDLGFLHDGELFITGRLKDLIIINGLNRYPQDIERTVEQSHSSCRPGCGAAFSIEVEGAERLVVVQELERGQWENTEEVFTAIRQRVAEEHELQLHAICLVKPGAVPKTSSGKIQRRACRAAFINSTLEPVAQWVENSVSEPVAIPGTTDEGSLQSWLQAQLAATLSISASRIDVAQPILGYGLDSLSGIELIHKIETGLGVTLPVATVLENPSISDLAEIIRTAGTPWPPLESVAAPNADQTTHPLSINQQSLWFMYQMAPESAVYNLSFAASLNQNVDATALKRAFDALVKRHASLRTTFIEVNGAPVQKIHPEIETCFDVREAEVSTLDEQLAQEAHRPFDLQQGSLLRLILFTRNGEQPVLLMVAHHIIVDFWSLSVLMHELSDLYTAENPNLAPVKAQYTDYARRQQDMLAGDAGQRHWSYWEEQLSGTLPILNLPTDRPRPPVQTYNGSTQRFSLKADLLDKIKAMGQRSGATLYMTLLAAYEVLLSRYTGQDEILVGTPTAGRGRGELADVVGYFVNPVVLRSRLSAQQSFASLLAQTRQNVIAAFEHQDYPFALLVQRLQPEREASRTPVFQTMFVLQKSHLLNEALATFALGGSGAPVKLGALTLEPIPVAQRAAQFDLMLMMAEVNGQLEGSFEYNTDLFEASTIARLATHFERLLEALVAEPQASIWQLEILGAEEREQQLQAWNDTRAEYAEDICIHQLFEAQVERTPEAVAVVFGAEQVSYRELNERANQLAEYLRGLGVGTEVRVGVLLERSADMLVALLGIMKAGGAYVPLDPTYPQERLNFMARDAELAVLLTQESLRELVALPTSTRLLCVDSEQALIAECSNQNPGVAVNAGNLAYLIYTSGSTGAPKAVAIEHHSTTTLIQWALGHFSHRALSSVLASTSLCFDLSVFELFVPLSVGGHVIVVENALALPHLAARDEVTLINTVPSAMAELVRQQALPANVQVINLAGEALGRALVESIYEQLPDSAVYNLYGPSEDTTYSTAALIASGDGAPSIGRPVSNTQAYVLDRELQLVPAGVSGELYLSGDGLARGYLNRPKLTADRFVPNPFSSEAGARMYRTGDLVRYRSTGELEYLGRGDQQVKVRGYRVELGEIEARLAEHEQVREAVVVVHEEDGDKRLVAYLVAQSGQVQVSELRASLKASLPGYMIPSAFVVLPELPLTTNGKVNRRALPAPEWTQEVAESAGPRTPVEAGLLDIWAAVLKVTDIGIHDNFFELGGHSLLATQIVSRVRQTFAVELPLHSLFERPTVAGLSELVEEALRAEQGLAMRPIRVMERDETTPIPLSFAQQRLWFLDQLEPGSAQYNMPAAVRLTGELNIRALEQSLTEVIRRHEALRTVFTVIDGDPVQIIKAASPFELPLFDLSAEPELETSRLIAAEAQRPFDLTTGPLLRAQLLKLSSQEHIILLTMHHIVSDGWSLGVLVSEVAALYQAYLEDRPSSLPELTIQYADFAYWQREWLQGEVLDKQLDYWKKQLDETPALLELPTDRPRPATQSFVGANVSLELSKSLTQSLKALSQQEGTTLFMTLLSAFQILLSRYSGKQDILVGTPIANRNHAETENLIGFFVNTLVLRTDLSGKPTCSELLRRVREVCLGAYAHQDVPFEKLVEALKVERSLSHTPLFQVLFALQNAPFEALQLPQLTLEPLDTQSATAKFDLSLSLQESDGALHADWNYNTDLFEASTIERLATHFERLLEALVAKPEASIWQLEILGAEEREQQLQAWNDTRAEYAEDICIHQLFEAQVERTPEAVAVVFGAEQLSYRELNERANQLAEYLRGLGVGTEVRVGVLLERSAEMLVALLGIMKAGGAYVPLDPTYPQERLNFMASDAELAVLLTQEALRGLVELPTSTRLVCIDSEQALIAECSNQNPVVAMNAGNLAYLIYTSGSTGAPKAVAIEHHSTATLIQWALGHFSGSALSSVLASTSLCFDLSVFELFVPLSVGGQVIVAENALALPQLVARDQVTLINTVPSAMAELVRQQALTANVQVINLAGEALGRALVESIYEQLPGSAVYNLYGPSEDTTYSTAALIARGDGAPAIGRPVSNTQAYVLDRELQLAPAGVSGELYLSGDGVARGYLNRPELTADRFVPNPFSSEAGARMYRTGDLVRYRSTGELEYLGRGDQQVKVRGYRVELGEIEARLAEHEQVREAVVVVRGEGDDKRIVAYLVAQSGELQGSELRTSLKESLPGYMIPSAFVVLPELPLTANGKVNRRALPAPEWTQEVADSAGPRTPVEAGLLDIWAAVLKVANIGIHDNFFELGGHSLLATRLISHVRQSFQVELPLRTLFESPTVAQFAEQVERAASRGQRLEAPPILPREKTDLLPLSFAQQRLWFLDQLEPDSASYNIPMGVRLEGELNVDALENALTEITKRHEALRTTFELVDGEPRQVVAALSKFTCELTDLRVLPEPQREAEAKRIAREEAAKGFDLSIGPLIRVRLLSLNEQEHILLLTMHHIVSDGWSIGVFLRELSALYEAFVNESESMLPELPIQYVDFSIWQREWLTDEAIESQLAYWREQLTGAPTVLGLPTDRPRPVVQSFSGASYTLVIDRQLTQSLKALSGGEGATLFMTLLAAFQILLSRYTGQRDILVGTPIANRTRSELEDLIGLFMNTLVIRTRLSLEDSFRDLLTRVRNVTLGAYAHQDVPFEKLVEALQVERSLSHTPLFQVLFALQNAPFEALQLPRLTLDPLDTQSATAKFDLSLSLQESDGALHAHWNYNTDLFDASTIARLATHFQRLLEALVAKPQASIWQLEILGAEEGEQQLQAWNDTRAEYEVTCIHELFEAQVERTPEGVAVVFGAEQLSYRELNERANQLAEYLLGLGVGAEVRVGVLLERSAEMVVALLGIMKAGGAYVPLDPTYPQERLNFMASDAELAVLLTQESLRELIEVPTSTRLLCVDSEQALIAECSKQNGDVAVNAGNLAYLIYTSGSTGTPKGVQITHQNVVNFLQSMSREPGLTERDTLLSVTTLSFDIAGLELFLPLTVGAQVVVATREVAADGEQLSMMLVSSGATVMQATPATWRLLIESGWQGDQSLKMLCGGEALPGELAARMLERGATLWNLYGPTETTIWSSISQVTSGEGTPSIGRPIANTQAYVLDRELQLVPAGVSGELYLSGDGVARGYLNRPELTADRFVPNPFSPEAGARMYRTGDVVRYRSTGELEYLGRGDQQVKVRGYRVELGEIEARLAEHEQVREAVVVVREEDGDKQIVAYLVAQSGELQVSELRRYLKERLPAYMVPAQFVTLAELPLTANGKVNRRALPAPEWTQTEVTEEAGARTPVEAGLLDIWAAVLKVSDIGIHDNFFDLGGHSLLATQLVSRVRQTFAVELALRSLFERPTVAGLSELVEEALRAEQGLAMQPIGVVERDETTPIPLSFAQQRLWFLDQLEPGSAQYNIPAAVRLTGELNTRALEQSLTEVIRRHETLRTSFSVVDEQPVQVISPSSTLALAADDLRHLEENEREPEVERLAREEAKRPFDLKQGPLMRAKLVRLSEQDHVLLFTMHHIITDGWSLGVLIREVAALYEAFSADDSPSLAELPIQYADFTIWQREWLNSGVLDKQLTYWKEQLSGAPAVLEFPTDRPRPAAQSFRGAKRLLKLQKPLVAQLKDLSRREDATLFMTLLAAFQTLLYRYTGQQDISVGTPIANRSHWETEALIGFFTNTLVMRNDLSGNPTLTEFLQRVKEVALGAYAHQEVPFEKLVEELQVKRSLSYTPLFQVMFGLQSDPRTSLQLPSLTLDLMDTASETTHFDMSLSFTETSDEIRGELEYNTDLFDATTIERLTDHFFTLLYAIVVDPARKLSSLPMLSIEERYQLKYGWNSTAFEFAHDRFTHQLFEVQAALSPNKIALTFEDIDVTYAELNERANQLAHLLIDKGVGAETCVGVCVERSVEMVVALLAIFKAGGAYLPLESQHPQERLSFMLADARPRVVITQQQFSDRFAEFPAEVICFDTDADSIASMSSDNPAVEIKPADLAYVIYTSGSTGRPKGVQVEHQHLLGTLLSARLAYGFTSADVVPCVATYCFDIYLFELLSPLLVGGRSLIMNGREVLEPRVAKKALEEVTFIHATPGLMRQFVEVVKHVAEPERYGHIRQVMVGGDAVSPELLQELQSAFINADVSVGYGPTETTIMCGTYTVERGQKVGHKMLGSPMANCRMIVRDSEGELVPIGVVGEVLIGGDGVARGYLNQEQLTAEKYVMIDGERYYRSGDLGRRLEDGNIAFAGRVDEQVKVRGFRVELGEVESALIAHPGIKECVVVAREEGGEKSLVAYAVAEAGSALTLAELRSHMGQRLPEYMAPSAIVVLDEMPLTPHGKIDKRALPDPEVARLRVEREYVAPRTPVENLLAGIWANLLNVERIGVHDDFFDFGGHSLLATQLVSRVRDALQVEIPVRRLFEGPTIAQFAEHVDTALRSGDELVAPPIITVPKDAPLPLSFAQQRLWFIDQLEPGSFKYNMPHALRLSGPLNVDVMEATLTEIVRRHEVLRTSFVVVDGEPVQVINPPQPLKIDIIDISDKPQEEHETELLRLASAEVRRVFDLKHDLLLRMTLVRLGEEEHVALFTTHHIASDGWSITVLVKEVVALYGAFVAGLPSPLPELSIQYADFAVWQRQWLQGEVLEKQLAYWKQQLEGSPAVLELPTDRPRLAIQKHPGANQQVLVPNALADSLKELSRREGATLFMTLLAAFETLLMRYSGQDDLNVGMPIANRNRGETEALIGFFANTLVMRGKLSGDPTFTELLQRVKEVALGAYAHQDVPFEKLVEEMHVERSLSHSPLFQVMFVLENVGMKAPELTGLLVQPLPKHTERAIFDMSLGMIETEGGIVGELEYNTDLFNASTIERFTNHFLTLLNSIVIDPIQKLSELTILTPAERRVLVYDWNRTDIEFPQELLTHQIIAAQAALTPDAIALRFGDQQLRYDELNRRVNQLANLLIIKGVGAEVPVGLSVSRSLDMVISLLAIFKAGGAYLPLEPEYPQERLRFIVNDAKPRVVLTHEEFHERFDEFSTEVICLDSERGLISAFSDQNPAVEIREEDLAYVIYTSGSTGRPKGVQVEHRHLLHTMTSSRHTYGFTAADVVPCVAPFSFDIYLFEVLSPLLVGGTSLLLKSREVLDAVVAEAALAQVTFLHSSTGVMRQLVNVVKASAGGPSHFEHIRHVFVGGDAVSPELVREMEEAFTNAVVSVGYGPTEATIMCASYPVKRAQDVEHQMLGYPLANCRMLVCDKSGEVVPVGVVGEVWIGGAGVARGYLNQPELTAEKFVVKDGERYYRSGDLGRWLEDGSIAFAGRADEQVKVRGFRVELGEVEAVLSVHGALAEAVVVARPAEGGERQLVAYVVPKPGQEVTSAELRRYLRDRLPDYLVPSAIVTLEAMPLTPLAKIDRRALPAPEMTRPAVDEAFNTPRTPVEEGLARIWCEVLKLDHVGIHENFFALGGHSLLATQLISRIREVFQVEIPLQTLFEKTTVAELGESVEEALCSASAMAPPIEPISHEGELMLSFAQQRLWFLDQFEPGSSSYNIPAAVKLAGTLNREVLEDTLTEIVRRHESLRTTFVTVAGEPRAVVAAPERVVLSITDLSNREEAERQAEAMRLARNEAQLPFDLAAGPLLRASLLKLGEEDHVVLLTMHHIISDGWSMDVFIREFSILYSSFLRGVESPLDELPIQYADFAHWQQSWLTGDVLEQQLSYWREQLRDAPPVLELPVDHARPPVQSFRGATHSVLLSEDLTSAAKALSREQGTTLFMTLLAAFQTLLWRYTGQPGISVGTPIANRNRGEIEQLIGFFINTLVLHTEFSDNPSFADLIRRVRSVCLRAYAHQDVPFEKLVDELQPERSLSHAPLFQVMFALQNAPLSELKLPNLSLSPLEWEYATAKFDLSLTLEETNGSLRASWEYSTDLFDAATIERMASHFETLLEGAIADPKQKLSDLALLSSAEAELLLVEWNDTAKEIPSDHCIQEFFETQVARTPNSIAVVCDNVQLTYAELNARANQLAHHLLELGVRNETRVGLCVERSVEVVVGLLGIFKAGGVYVPLDPQYPQERLAFMLEDSQVALLVTESQLMTALPQHSVRTVCLDTDAAAIASQSESQPRRTVTPESLAYLIYTSGSSGKPKAVMVQHHSLVNTVLSSCEKFAITEADVMPCLAAFSFDIALLELLMPLVSGGTLQIVTRQHVLDVERLVASVSELTIIHTVPSLMRQIVEFIKRADVTERSRYEKLRLILIGGDAVSPELLREIQEVFPYSHIEVLYGPTEATIICITYGVPGSEYPLERQTIGKPLPNVKISIRDRQQGIVPIGVAGEIDIAGRGVTLGYLHQPELTAEKYVTIEGERWYRSGDRGRFLADGNIEFLGRIDEQVKIKGFRIELGEIEARLNEHEGVREAVIVVREENGDKRLVAYVVASSETAPTVSELRGYLGEMLPEYMIPSTFITLDEMPLTANGKINRRALPVPDTARPDLALAFVAPTTAVEQTLAEIWSQVLKLESVGIHDNFFELGGDSILSIQIVARAQQAGLRLTPKQLFQYQTIAQLAEAVGTSSVVRANQGVVIGPVSLTPIQQWFLSHEVHEVNHYNQALLLEVKKGVELTSLERAVRELISHHDALRMRFERGEDGQWTQSNAGLEAAKDVWSIRDLSEVAADRQRDAIEAEAEQVQRSLNLKTGPLVRAVYVKLGDDVPGRLLLVVHHLVMDGVSWRVFLEDVSAAYEQLASGAESVKLPAKTTSYQEWAERLQEYAASEEVAKEFDYWNREANREVAALPIDTQIAGDNTVASARKISLSLSVDETRLLLTQATKKYRARINEVLLSAVMQGYTRWTGQTSLKVDVEGHGREQEVVGEVDVTRTVGWFTSVYPVVLDVAGGADVVTVLKRAKEDLRSIPREGIGYGVLRFMSPDPSVRTALAGAGKAEVTFNYLGQFDGVLNEDGMLRAAAEFAGASVDKNTKRHYAVEINGSISDGRLHLVWSYSEALHRRESIETFADESVSALRELIALSAIDTTSGLTPSDFPLAHVSTEVLDEMAEKDALIEDIYALSATQHGMLLHSLSAPDSEAYYDQTSCTLFGPLNVAAFEQAWQRVVNRHSVLRTAFIWQGLDEPLQVVHRAIDLQLAQHDWRSLSRAAQQKQLETLLEDDRKRGFKLGEPPLMRLTLVRTADEEYEFAWSWHHLLMDGWSLSIVFQQVFELYRSLSGGSETAPARSRSYREYISWLQQQDASQTENFWRHTLKDFTTPTAIRLKPVSSNGHKDIAGSFDNQNIQLPEETTAVLQALARRRQLTLNTFIQGAWAILLGHYSKTHDVVFGVTVSGRPAGLAGVEEIVGLFINTLPLRIQLSPELAILDWLQQVQQQLVDLRQYEYAPLVDVQRWSDVSRGRPLFESIVAFDNYPFDHDMLERAADVKIGNVRIVNWNNFPLSLVATPGATLHVEVKYERHRFAADDAAWIAQQFESLLRTISEQPQVKLLTLMQKLADADQQRQLNREANYQDNLRRNLRRTR